MPVEHATVHTTGQRADHNRNPPRTNDISLWKKKIRPLALGGRIRTGHVLDEAEESVNVDDDR
jgi:hypothetical protein